VQISPRGDTSALLFTSIPERTTRFDAVFAS
jgi:hypothetical protein